MDLFFVKNRQLRQNGMARGYGKNSILRLFCCFFLFCFTVFMLFGCASSGRNTGHSAATATSKPVYEMPPRMTPKLYIDVSAWNEEIDWTAVKESGVTGAILRIARYNLDMDPYFDEYYKGAKENGIKVGCYYFMNAQNEEEAREDARRLIYILESNGYEMDLPIFYDIEDEHDGSARVSNLGRELLTDVVIAFCEEMLANGFYAGYYSNLLFARSYYDPERLEKYPYWLASWKTEIYGNEYPNLTMWQMSAEGNIDGIEGDCDVNRCFVDFAAYIEEKGYNRCYSK